MSALLAEPIGILIVDDHELVRRGLRAVLEAEADMNVVGEAPDGETAVSSAAELAPAIVLMDLHMPGMGGVKACAAVKSVSPDSRVLVLTSYDDDEEVFEVLSAGGACGYLMKDVTPDSLVQAIRAAADGQTVLDSSIAGRIIGNRGAEQPRAEVLSEREREVLGLMAEGLGNREIGERLWITEATVKTHVTHILAKLGQSDRTQAVLAAVKLGLVEP